ncbi:ferrous iron transport protein B [Clostridium perfringens]|uniref:Ferrous iron transport protein B n=2 Tax=Clostridium perfringens TaxID=1502 RepID=A0A2X2V7X9_CLOPF|nr:ferrous iron transport protein B [Clostridium perfringens]ABG85866.1 ferrous iron transport protein B [Clostridium perfringens SM101]EJT5916112.1 ferrous iron transport protein B [Clostridium perfringens]EJT5924072.1 ferrous iron transport protein B [Clostridium perfringens]EJT5938285.1 ferrous iron transport protein B [Clostridium perfringens]EJT6134938.1 ferrous iron transport protein B [Clostridium perfringens]
MTTIALLGNPNVGKTTLFNALTGSNQHVGNWPGVTVDKKEGFFNSNKIVDLPGIYALDTFSNEEKVSKKFLESGDVDLILNIVDASNLDRNLYLTMQLKDFKKPIVLLLNMNDIAEKKGIKIDPKKLEKAFNLKVIPITASKKEGLDEVKEFLNKGNFEKYLDKNTYSFKDEADTYKFIEDKLSDCFNRSSNSSTTLTDKLDKIFLNPWLAYPLFIALMYFVFQFTFSWVGQPISDALDGFLGDTFMPYLSNLLSGTAPWFQSLLVDGIVAGVGGIIVLLPIILALFLCIAILEDSGYMARVAFLMDKFMRKIGLSGKAFLPMITGFGCTVPAIMSARTLESEKDRKLTALLAPFMSCNARLPVYVIFAGLFFPDNASMVVASLYILGILVAFILGLVFKNTLFKKDEEPFIIELPEYKVPEVRSVLAQLWDKSKSFLKKAGTIIFAMSVVIWFLQSFNFTGMVEDITHSFLYNIGSFIAPIFAPLGFGDWQASVSLLTGLMAKETIISTMEVIYKGDLTHMLPQFFTALSSYSFMVFVLLYTPCISVVGVMKKEYGGKFTILSVIFQFLVAWISAFIIYHIGLLIF